ncbi:hypothetical protein [Streptomyces sp. G1]|uniref:hypothetical protein n=1 Tax=Streptomyces sp. G1 TaxID=361572 RepID=UPI00202FDC9A|nr:hypothetical protein [Streptomyces sp. G1]MCM1972304.1 hypothetical protein [Streptomyces sp. G1]
MTSQGADEARIRHYLHALSARPLGHQDPAMTQPRPVTPTRIVPAGAPLPPRPPDPGETPPWWQKPPTPPPPAPPAPSDPDPGPVEVRHVHHIQLTWQDPDPDPDPDPPVWARAWDLISAWRNLLAVLAALVPWIDGHSPVGLWSHTLHEARTEAGIAAAYILAAVALAAAWAVDRRTGRAAPRFLLVTALLGSFGVLHWWDPIHLLTGVSL